MADHHYAVLDEDGVIVNVVSIDDEAVGWYQDVNGEKVPITKDTAIPELHKGLFEPWGHEAARAQGWVLLHPQPAGIGWRTKDGGKTFVHPANPNQVFTAVEPKQDRDDFVQPDPQRLAEGQAAQEPR